MAVSLSKGQSISLEKKDGGGLNRVLMGLGWDAKQTKSFFGLIKSSQEIDLDASCVMYDAQGSVLDSVWYRQLRSNDGAVVHTGDNRTGEGEGDDEQIIVELQALPEQVQTLVFTVNSFTGQTFDQVENCFCRLVDADKNEEVARYTLSESGSHTALIMAKVYREGGGWQMKAIGEPAYGQTIEHLLPMIKPHL
jgi:tellurium resistance protein TerZ